MNYGFFFLKQQDKFQKILEDIRKDTEYIQEIPKWQLEMQKRLDMLKQMRMVGFEAKFSLIV